MRVSLQEPFYYRLGCLGTLTTPRRRPYALCPRHVARINVLVGECGRPIGLLPPMTAIEAGAAREQPTLVCTRLSPAAGAFCSRMFPKREQSITSSTQPVGGPA